jgi:hypothetical protein
MVAGAYVFACRFLDQKRTVATPEQMLNHCANCVRDRLVRTIPPMRVLSERAQGGSRDSYVGFAAVNPADNCAVPTRSVWHNGSMDILHKHVRDGIR